MIGFADTRDRMTCIAARSTGTMDDMKRILAMTAAEPQALAFDAPESRGHAQRRDSFRSQTPLAVLAICAVAAIVAVNRPANAPTVAPAPVIVMPAAATDPELRCLSCGEVVSVQLVSLHPDTAPTIKTFELSVRMDDGTLRTVRQFAPVFDIGDRVRLNGGAPALRG